MSINPTVGVIEPHIVHDVGQARVPFDPRRAAIAVAMSRSQLRLSPEAQQDFITNLLSELDRVPGMAASAQRALKQPVPTAPAVLELVPPLEPQVPEILEHECAPCFREHVEDNHDCNQHCTLEHVAPDKEWELKRQNRISRRKNPAPGKRVCSLCKKTKSTKKSSTGMDGGEFVLHREKGGNKLSSRCRECLNAAAKNRYLSAGRLEALNMARLEFIVDDDVAGLRCLGCGHEFAVGDEVVARSGLRCGGCDEAEPEPVAADDVWLHDLVLAAQADRGSLS